MFAALLFAAILISAKMLTADSKKQLIARNRFQYSRQMVANMAPIHMYRINATGIASFVIVSTIQTSLKNAPVKRQRLENANRNRYQPNIANLLDTFDYTKILAKCNLQKRFVYGSDPVSGLLPPAKQRKSKKYLFCTAPKPPLIQGSLGCFCMVDVFL